MNGFTMDSARVLTEKLSLAREISMLKPELEHLRSQSAYQQAVLAEKLALERQVNSLEVELETEKRVSKRALEKNRNKDRELELQQQVDDLQKDLAREKKGLEKEVEAGKRALKRAVEKGDEEGTVEELQLQVQDLRKDLTREKHERAKERKEADKDLEDERNAAKRAVEKGNNKERELHFLEQIEDLRKELARNKREPERARIDAEKELEDATHASKRAAEKVNIASEKDHELQEQLENLQSHLAKERRDNEKARKQADKELSASETRKEVLESKLEQLRTKLRSVKEELKDSQTKLTQARAATFKAESSRVDTQAKTSRKRGMANMSTDDAIGTPDGVMPRIREPALKRKRPDQTILGEKSMFSVTPFLNKTVNVMQDGPAKDIEIFAPAVDHSKVNLQKKEASTGAPVGANASPSAPKTKKKLVEKKALGEKQVPVKKPASNKNLATKNPRALSTLENVTEADENERSAPVSEKIESANPDIVEHSRIQLNNGEEARPQKKKRKLLGGAKTLFDEEDGEATKRPVKINLGPPRLFGKGSLVGPTGRPKGRLGAASGFGGFSPLKKDRRGIGATFLA